MAKKKPKKQDETTEGDGSDAKKRKRPVVKIVAVLVALMAVGYVMGLGPFGKSDTAQAGDPTSPTTVAEGEYVNVPEATVNLTGGGANYLKYGMTLVLKKGVSAGDIESKVSLALDIANDLLSSRTVADLSAAGARDALKKQLAEQIGEAYDGDVVRVLLPRFTYQ